MRRFILPVIGLLIVIGLFASPGTVSTKFLVPGLVMVVLAVLLRTTMVCLREQKRARIDGSDYKWGVKQLLWRRESVAIVAYLIVFTALLWSSPNRQVFENPHWQRYAHLREYPAAHDAAELQTLTAELEKDIRGFDIDEAWQNYRVSSVYFPVIGLLVAGLIVYGFYRWRIASQPGGKVVVAVIQMVILLASASFVIPTLIPALPIYLKLLFGFAGTRLDFVTAQQQALFALFLAMIALWLTRSTHLWLTGLLALFLVGLSGFDCVKIAYPQIGRKAIKGEWGQTYGQFVSPAGVSQQEPGDNLIIFDTATLGPHPTMVGPHRGQWFQFEEVEADTAITYQYFEDPNKPVTSRRIVTVRGDTLSGGYPMYPRHTKFPGWFHTQDAPCGAVIFRLGGHGPWYPAFPPNQKDAGPQWSNFSGDVWIDINDTVFQNEGGEVSDGLAYNLDNVGVVRVRLRIMDSPSYAEK